MTFEEMAREAAHAADDAVTEAMNKYKEGGVTDEDDLTGVLVGRLDSALEGQIGGLTWNTTVVRHRRGRAAEERRTGADLVVHVSLDTSTERYSKGVLVQAKRKNPDDRMSRNEHAELWRQCRDMLNITPAAFIFDYVKGWMRVGPATRIAGSRRLDLYHICGWTSYRFFLELFRCPIGDPKITSARVDDLPAPYALKISATGDLSDDDYPLGPPSK
ncbi:MAG TPA: hypothetical protein VNU65_12970 [Xanthobacteraceae bacterium]|jgi:hypothetical protein|nr:hypothetical protein [Xanthobacteraceae bacterium]